MHAARAPQRSFAAAKRRAQLVAPVARCCVAREVLVEGEPERASADERCVAAAAARGDDFGAAAAAAVFTLVCMRTQQRTAVFATARRCLSRAERAPSPRSTGRRARSLHVQDAFGDVATPP